MDNIQVQADFNSAVNILRTSTNPAIPELNETLATWLEWVRIHSESGNGIPGLRGRGLEQALAVSHTVIENANKF